MEYLTHYHLAVLIGFVIHLVQKYVVTPGWNLSRFMQGEWRYVATSVVLTAFLAFFGTEIMGMVIDSFGLADNFNAALRNAPTLFGVVIGMTGGSIAYNLPMLGPVLKDMFAAKPKPEGE
jgi:hypothetical protein